MQDVPETGATASPSGRVVASFGTHALVALENGEQRECSIRGKRLRPVAGDVVAVTTDKGSHPVINRIEPRRTELARQTGRAGRQILAANVDLLIVMVAPEPPPEPGIVDRYLATAEAMGVGAVLVWNKMDLGAAERPGWLSEFQALGYPVLETSAAEGTGITALSERLARHTAILVGQSGVGKSTLLNRLIGETVARVESISGKSREGRHTTTTARLYNLPGGGALIDSPGVRDFHLQPLPPERIPALFREIREAAVDCRFNDCTHREEPGCNVLAAVAAGQISARRHRSYRRLYEQMLTLAERNPALFGSSR